jgi:FtsZ-interacting cell division protein ZipA
MLRTAETFCEKLSGELVDDNRKPLTPAGIGMIKRSLEQVFHRMEAHGIPAGTPAARRLFS